MFGDEFWYEKEKLVIIGWKTKSSPINIDTISQSLVIELIGNSTWYRKFYSILGFIILIIKKIACYDQVWYDWLLEFKLRTRHDGKKTKKCAKK